MRLPLIPVLSLIVLSIALLALVSCDDDALSAQNWDTESLIKSNRK